jgi:hypothetical protein
VLQASSDGSLARGLCAFVSMLALHADASHVVLGTDNPEDYMNNALKAGADYMMCGCIADGQQFGTLSDLHHGRD